MHKKIKEKIEAVFFFFFCKISLSQKYPTLKNLLYKKMVLQQIAEVVKHKIIKCKQSVEGPIISQILKLSCAKGESDVNEMEIIQ